MYDRFAIGVVTAVLLVIAAAFFVVLVLLEPNAGTAPPYVDPNAGTTQDAGEAHGGE